MDIYDDNTLNNKWWNILNDEELEDILDEYKFDQKFNKYFKKKVNK